MSSRADAIEISFTMLNSARRRLRFEPRSDGMPLHFLEEDVREDGAWRPVGRAIVEDVDLDAPEDCRSDGGSEDTPPSICNECPVCGAVGLPERIENHDCGVHLRRQRVDWGNRR